MITQEQFNKLEMEYGCGYWNICWEHACPCAITIENKGLTKEIYDSLVEEAREIVEMDEQQNDDYYEEYGEENSLEDIFYEDYEQDWFEEEDLLINFTEKQLPLYEKAVQEFGDDTLFISDETYHSNGFRLEGYYSLRTKEHKDRHEFWNLFDSIRKSF